MSEYIKGMLATQGWKETEGMFNDAINKCGDLETLTKEGSNEVLAREARVSAEVQSKLKDLLKRIKLAGTEKPVNKPKVMR